MKTIKIAWLLASLTPSFVQAGDLENIKSCVSAVKDYTGSELSANNARYTANILSNSVATWPNVRCEVKFETVYLLVVGSTTYIVEGFAGEVALAKKTEMDKKTDIAIAELNTRISNLRKSKEEATNSLRAPRPNLVAIEAKLDASIDSALGVGAKKIIENIASERAEAEAKAKAEVAKRELERKEASQEKARRAEAERERLAAYYDDFSAIESCKTQARLAANNPRTVSFGSISKPRKYKDGVSEVYIPFIAKNNFNVETDHSIRCAFNKSGLQSVEAK